MSTETNEQSSTTDLPKPKKKEQFFKIILVGDAAVGKSSIVRNYVTNNFSKEYHVTIGVEFASKDVKLDDGQTTKIQIWDAAGQECFRSIVRSFYRNAAAFLIIYNICAQESFASLSYWLQDARDNQTEDAIIVLIGNQSDREDERLISTAEGQKFADENGVDIFIEVSAKTGKNIEQLFKQVAEKLYLKAKEGIGQKSETKDTATLKASKTTEQPKKKSGCCR